MAELVYILEVGCNPDFSCISLHHGPSATLYNPVGPSGMTKIIHQIPAVPSPTHEKAWEDTVRKAHSKSQRATHPGLSQLAL